MWDELMDFDRVSAIYDADIVPFWGRPFSQLLRSELPSALTGSILEVGAGTGYLAIELAALLQDRARIIALEPSHDMLEVAFANGEQEIRKKKVFFQHHDFQQRFRFADDVFSLVYSNLGLYYQPMAEILLPEVLRVLEPGHKAFFTLPLRGSFVDFFNPITTYLDDCKEYDLVKKIERDLYRYPSPEEALYQFRSAGFHEVEIKIHRFKMIFEDGLSLFQSPFVRYNFLEDWAFSLHRYPLGQLLPRWIELFDILRQERQIELMVHAGCLIATKT